MTDKKAAKEKGVSSGSLRRMAKDGDFGPEEMRRCGVPDEIISSRRDAESQKQGVDSS